MNLYRPWVSRRNSKINRFLSMQIRNFSLVVSLSVLLVLITFYFLTFHRLEPAINTQGASREMRIDSQPPKLGSTKGREVYSDPAHKGFVLVSTTDHSMIYPDLSHQVDFRTSQLIMVNGKAYASRKVLYRSISKPKAVVVLAMDAHQKPEVLQAVLEERKKFCTENEYGLYARYIQDFAAEGIPFWESLGLAPIRMLHQAMLAFPEAEWFWHFSAIGHIKATNEAMLPLLSSDRGSLQLAMDTRDQDVSIKSLAHSSEQANIILSTDPAHPDKISSNSIMLKRSLPAIVFLEMLGDPVVQHYDEFKVSADHAGTAITHLARWHPYLASSIALVSPQWSGIQPCDDSFDHGLACTYKSDHDWIKDAADKNQ